MTSLYTFELKQPKLGFKLDKDASKPILSDITPGGCFECLLLKDQLDPKHIVGSTIVKFDGNDVHDMPYEKIWKMIRLHLQRPVSMTIEVPEIRQSYVPTQVAYQKTKEQMDRESEQATKQALRDLVKCQLESHLSESESDSESESGFVSESSYRKLQSKFRYNQLKLQNAEMEMEDFQSEMSSKYEPILQVNDLLCQINSLKQRYHLLSTNRANYTGDQLESKNDKMFKEFKEYKHQAESLLKSWKITLVQGCVEKSLEQELSQFAKYSNEINRIIFWKHVYEALCSLSLFILLMSIILCFIR
jgi:hypothetical protein